MGLVTPPARSSRAGKLPEALPDLARQALGDRLKHLREVRQLSLRDLGAIVGMSPGTLGDLERGRVRNPPLATVLRLMAALEVDSIELLFGEPEFASARIARSMAAEGVIESSTG